ncbi:MAG: hypothetical protein IJY23_01065 [Clostridia bacterium]|nr:hypothetical protein [Clostridia bacterium]
MKLKQYEVTSRVEFFSEPIGDILRRYRTIKKYAYILHDKDPDTAPHYHIYLNFGNSGVDSKIVAQWFGLQESQVNKIQGRATDMLQYLTHSNESQKNKYQYSPSEVIANFDFEEEIKRSKILGNFKEYSYAQQLEYVDSLPVAEKVTAFNKLKKLWELRCEVLMLNPERDIEVMFIYGKSGTGKTTNAKQFARSRGFDFYVSSSSNDPLQDYRGQKCIILDDARDSTFEFEDWLKLTDNNTASSVKSKYYNKVLMCNLIIITSSVPLSFWFRYMLYNKSEDLKQFYRRISAYVEITDSDVSVYESIDSRGRPSGFPKMYHNRVAELKAQPKKKKTDFGKAFGAICDEIPIEQVIEFFNSCANKK